MPAHSTPSPAADYHLYFGTQRSGPNLGFSRARFDAATGTLTPPQLEIVSSAPTFFSLDGEGRHLYAINAGDKFEGQPGGGVSAFRLDPVTGHLAALNTRPAGGAGPCHISLDRTGRFALTACYNAGCIAVFAIQGDGSLGERTAFFQHTGRSIDPVRQTRAYAHSIIVDPTNRFALVADLGLDRIVVYRFDEKTGTLAPHDPAFATVTPGAGPRHTVFHPNAQQLYVINEMANTITGFHWDASRGELAEFQTVPTLPAGFTNPITCAEILIHPNGKFLYGSNRGHDSLAVFALDATTGHLSFVQHVSSGGKNPRNFSFDPTGQWVLVTNHNSDNVVVFRADPITGQLTQHGEPVSVPYPFCLRFLAVANNAP